MMTMITRPVSLSTPNSFSCAGVVTLGGTKWFCTTTTPPKFKISFLAWFEMFGNMSAFSLQTQLTDVYLVVGLTMNRNQHYQWEATRQSAIRQRNKRFHPWQGPK